MQHSQFWINTIENGLYCERLDAFIDPVNPVHRKIIRHGHADHARSGHSEIYATPETITFV
ncbi:MAG: putative mRNA 3-end processing factor [Glaciecola sp.]|jgi:putative mRNA 3-end processing factor